MKKTLMTVAAAVLAAAPLAAQPEALTASAAAQFRAASLALPAFKFVSVSPAAAALAAAGVKAQSVTVLDIEKFYNSGAKVSKAEVSGWYAGRRYSAKGATAQLLVSAEVLRDADAGSLGGSDFKLSSVGGAEPVEGMPATIFDDLGSETVNNILFRIADEGASWKTADFTDTGVRGQDSRAAFEVRKNGDLLVAKYSDGTYAYFFKRVR
jgi:hypothetical protein